MSGLLKRSLSDALGCVNYLLWPQRCGVCGRYTAEADGYLCRECWKRLGMVSVCDYCPSCGVSVSQYAIIGGKCPECDDGGLNFDGLVRVGDYEDVLRDMILAIKHAPQPQITGILGYQLLCAAKSKLPLGDIDMFIPVPLHWRRRLIRGYNQTMRLADAFASDGLAVKDVLIRKRYTRPQPGLTYSRRLKNVKGAFKCSSPALINGATVCLIDDIKTTGATLSECAKVLKASGAAKVYAAVIAVAHSSHPAS